jgi:hypothetical protein
MQKNTDTTNGKEELKQRENCLDKCLAYPPAGSPAKNSHACEYAPVRASTRQYAPVRTSKRIPTQSYIADKRVRS